MKTEVLFLIFSLIALALAVHALRVANRRLRAARELNEEKTAVMMSHMRAGVCFSELLNHPGLSKQVPRDSDEWPDTINEETKPAA